jgi:membrane-bound metal-dependent hydrolase YbcI (DUF457 family)
MFVGHYGVSFAAKRAEGTIPLWVLFLAVQFLDVLWAPCILLGIERVRIVPGITASNPLDLYYMPYTHSLVAALVWSCVGALAYQFIARPSRRQTSAIVGLAVFSHWILDLVVHRPDLPLYDNSAKVGLGLWNHPAVAFGLEAALLFGGVWLCLRGRYARSLGTLVFGLLMLAIQAYVFFGPPPTSDKAAAATALVAYAVFAIVVRQLERPSAKAVAAI